MLQEEISEGLGRPEGSLELPHGRAVHRRILEELRQGRLAPGDRLRETELAGRFGVSRTPVREAIRRLEAEGIVAHVPRRGATVRRLSRAEIAELYEMRAVLEGTAARLAARAATDFELGDLEDLNRRFAAAEGAGEAVRLNRLFHAALLDSARNRFLASSMRSLRNSLTMLGPTTLSRADRTEKAAGEHAAVLMALEGRDGEAAEGAMRAHIQNAQKARARTLRRSVSADESW